MLKSADPASKQAALATIRAPKFVQTTAGYVLLFGIVLFLYTVVIAITTHHWMLILVGLWETTLALSLMGSLLQLKRWAWWVTVLGGGFYALRDTVGLLADAARQMQHLPIPNPQFVPYYVIGTLLLWPIVVRLLMRPSRMAFWSSPVASVAPLPSDDVWPPPPTEMREASPEVPSPDTAGG